MCPGPPRPKSVVRDTSVSSARNWPCSGIAQVSWTRSPSTVPVTGARTGAAGPAPGCPHSVTRPTTVVLAWVSSSSAGSSYLPIHQVPTHVPVRTTGSWALAVRLAIAGRPSSIAAARARSALASRSGRAPPSRRAARRTFAARAIWQGSESIVMGATFPLEDTAAAGIRAVRFFLRDLRGPWSSRSRGRLAAASGGLESRRRSGEQLGHAEARPGGREGADEGAGLQHAHRRVAPASGGGALGIAIDLEHVAQEVGDPVVGDARARVQTALAVPIPGERRVGHLDDEDR